MKFTDLAKAIGKQFQEMTTTGLYRVKIGQEDPDVQETPESKKARKKKEQADSGDKDHGPLWNTYLAAFPEGTNPIYSKRTEHDCSACRSFIRKVGSVVTIVDGKINTLWDVEVGGGYQPVVDAMAELVKKTAAAEGIHNLFLHTDPTVGIGKNHQLLEGKPVKEWNHYFINLPKDAVVTGADIGPKLSTAKSTYDVMIRGLRELTDESVETVLEIIAQNSLYKGNEYQHILVGFQKLKQGFNKLKTPAAQSLFCWSKLRSTPPEICRTRNVAIGTLLIDLSEGMELEDAVKKFETSVVAPDSFKRPTALVSKAQVARAREKVAELGFESALERCYAPLADITINNVIWADRTAKKSMKSKGMGAFDELSDRIPEKAQKLDRVEEMPIETFFEKVLPTATSVELMVENRHVKNLVSLVGPADPTSKLMFRWGNRYSWSYINDLADSEMRQTVVARGGSVTGVFRFTHQWNYDKRNASLMDLHVFMPGNSHRADGVHHESYGSGRRVGWNHRQDTQSGGVQDVDYVDAAPVGYVPLENITFPTLAKMPEGIYTCKIHNWNLRQPTQGGFKAEIEFGGQIFQYEVDRPLKHHEWVTVAEVTLKGGEFTIKHHLPHGDVSRVEWGIPTQTFRKVNVIMLSPNYWDGQNDGHANGHKHYFFMLDQCIRDGTARGFYNEFLTPALREHHKVFEQVGAKMRTEASELQLSGIGLSSTRKNDILCRVKGSFTRQIKLIV